jgi:hypothetical protein
MATAFSGHISMGGSSGVGPREEKLAADFAKK